MTHKDFALEIAKESGKIMRSNFKIGMKKDWKENDTPVTKTDLAINKLVIEKVKKHYPTHSVLGEEASSLKEGAEFVWVCDPVDGTIPFSHGIPTSVFSLALVKNSQPILGVVYDPFMDRMFYAEKGKGSFMNGKRIKVSNRDLKNSVLDWDAGSISRLIARYPDCVPVRLFCIIYGGVLVACGELVAAFYSGTYPHDGATLKIIVEEAGGKVTDIFGKDQKYDRKIKGCLVTNGKVHKDLLKISSKVKLWQG